MNEYKGLGKEGWWGLCPEWLWGRCDINQDYRNKNWHRIMGEEHWTTVSCDFSGGVLSGCVHLPIWTLHQAQQSSVRNKILNYLCNDNGLKTM